LDLCNSCGGCYDFLSLEPIWAHDSLATQDPLELVLPFDEEILEAMNGPDRPWDDLHHRSYFLLELRGVEVGEFVLIVNGDSPCLINPLSVLKIYAKCKMTRIYTTIPIDISKTPGVMENVFIRADCSPKEIQTYTKIFKYFHDIFSWSSEEIPVIDPRIVEHEITTYPDAKPV
jgi:hypothetical protein